MTNANFLRRISPAPKNTIRRKLDAIYVLGVLVLNLRACGHWSWDRPSANPDFCDVCRRLKP